MPQQSELDVIGQRQPRLDGPQKVSGRSLFTDDVQLPGMLWGKVLRSRYAHARITRIDASKALAMPGVKVVVTGDDSTDVFVNEYEPAICKGVARYIGEEIAAVAAFLAAEESSFVTGHVYGADLRVQDVSLVRRHRRAR